MIFEEIIGPTRLFFPKKREIINKVLIFIVKYENYKKVFKINILLNETYNPSSRDIYLRRFSHFADNFVLLHVPSS